MAQQKYTDGSGVAEIWANIKNYIAAQLLGKSNTGHTHTKSEITDFPTIPSNTSQLTNDSGYITSSGSCSYSTTSGTSTYSTYLNSLGAQTPKSGRDIFHSGVYTYTTFTDTNTPAHYGAVIGYGNGQGGSCEMFAEWVGRGNLWFRVLRDCDDSWTDWQRIITSDNIGSQSVNYANSAGSCNYATSAGSAGSVAWDNVSGKPSAFTPYFANGTWYAVGDDAAIGDHNVGGGLGVKALNSTTTRIDLCYKDDASNYKSITYDGTTLYMNGNCDYATNSGYTNWLRTSSHADHLLHTEWDGGYFWTYVTAGDGGYRPVRVERSNSSGWADSAGSVAWGNVSGRPTIPTKTSQLTNDSGFITSGNALPVGSYIQFAGSQAPAGFLVCNGGAISRTTYSALFAVIGTTYGSGDGSTTFNLPNLTDRFLQGSTGVGTVKNAGLPNIEGTCDSKPGWFGWAREGVPVASGAMVVSGNTFATAGATQKSYSTLSFDASRCSSIYGNSSTVQPPALTCLICIKY